MKNTNSSGLAGFPRIYLLAVTIALLSTAASSRADFFQGFETDNSGWNVYGGSNDATRVPSGTNGITASSGSFYGQAATGTIDNNGDGSAATDFGGASATFGGGFTTSLDIYLKFGTTNDTRFDWDTAISDNSGNFLRDFVFNAGFYNDTDGTGSGNRFVISASNNAGRANAFPKNPGRDPFTILTEGWYTFTDTFSDVGGQLVDTMSIFDSSHNLLHSWTLTPGDAISGVGGVQYGWVVDNEFSSLAIDNSQLTNAVPEPSTGLLVFGALALYGVGSRVCRRRR
jgi:hypothetical protein